MFGESVQDNDEWLLILANLRTTGNSFDNPIKIEDAELLVNDYVAGKNELIKAIEDWLKAKTSITINLEMDLPNQNTIIRENS